MRVIILATSMLGACANYGQMHRDMNTSISALEGQSIEVAIDRLGLPKSTMPLGEDTVYVWAKENVLWTGEADETPLRCEVRIRADQAGVIRSGSYDGNQGACFYWRDKLAG